ncbi:hypothetical protein SAMN05421594_1679 [Chryseobacterium oleae]|uniref:Uncharacterized protein n=1 Tax=Chryseobacterium oleae TaxID=491207 RepID=A0A1I4XBA0_CHROL|nr:hypothetical protein [Chryseobacterium oleae]SFN23164.1 hypothetical protein SAMN05421594_1679 [Chryseobacterium oleae]
MNYRLLIALIPLILTNTNCTSQQKGDSGAVVSNGVQKKSKIEKIEITEQTRGTNRLISFAPGSKTTSVNGTVSEDVLSAAAWESIVKQAELIDLDKIASLKSPSEGRFGDRAFASTILITSGGKTYESSTFDSGVPPKELESLYRELFVEIKSKQKLPKKGLR